MKRHLLLIAAALALPAAHVVHAAEPVKRVAIYVTPFYEAARDPGGTPKVSVAKSYDALLASNRVEDIVRARDEIAKNNALLTPMTLMVLAIRLYDVGLRDDAVFWFYVAKDRFFTLAMVADIDSPKLAQAQDAVKSFATLAGPVINGYAFCDFANQQRQQAKALQWVTANPYQALFLPQIPARPGDRQENLKKALVELKANLDKERAHMQNAENAASFRMQRATNDADRKFCWK